MPAVASSHTGLTPPASAGRVNSNVRPHEYDAMPNRGALLLLRTDGTLLPVWSDALNVAEGWPWTIRKGYRNALILRPTGAVERVEGVNIVKPYGASLLTRFFSLLNSNWTISLSLVQVEVPFVQIKASVLEGLRLDQSSGRRLFEFADADAPSLLATATLGAQDFFKFLGLEHPNFTALDAL